MGIINKIFSSVNGLYNNINPITLSGVNDVIVVRGADGFLRCSPFQLRFSKIKFYNSKSKTVHLYVNEKLTDICMTITSMGDLFFEQQKAIDNTNYDVLAAFIDYGDVCINDILGVEVIKIDHKYCETKYCESKRLNKANLSIAKQTRSYENNIEGNADAKQEQLNSIDKKRSESGNYNKNRNIKDSGNIHVNKITNKIDFKELLNTNDNSNNTDNSNNFNNTDNSNNTDNFNNIYNSIIIDNFNKVDLSNVNVNKSKDDLLLLDTQNINLMYNKDINNNINDNLKNNNNKYKDFSDEISKINDFETLMGTTLSKKYISRTNCGCFRKYFYNRRIVNLNFRIFGKNKIMKHFNNFYSVLNDQYSKVNLLLNSAEHYVNLLEKQKILLYFMEKAINNDSNGPDILFSSCLNNKIENSLDETFNKYMVRDIEEPDNIVVKIEGVFKPLQIPNTNFFFNSLNLKISDENNNGKENLDKILYKNLLRSKSIDDSIYKDAIKDINKNNFELQQNVKFFLPYRAFTKLFFELRNSRNKIAALVKFLETEHNKLLGWNIFGVKNPIKSDIEFSLKLDSNELELLKLNPGKNDVIFKISGQPVQLTGNIYLWDVTDKIIVTDIDGTITKSDILGHIYNFVGKDWTHNGVAELFSQIVKNNYKIIYLTARALGQSNITRNYIHAVDQDSFTLPDGPIILSPDGIFGALYREVIAKKPEDFKIHCLQSIKELFGDINPFFAGFGNKVSDAYTYKVLGIPNNRIYTINSEGKLLAEYTQSLVGTYHTMNEFIDSIFPKTKNIEVFDDHDYSDFKWWG